MNFYRCLICGDTYLGKETPSNCPFCGAKDKYIVNAADWVDENISLGSLTDISRINLEKALQLEVNNAPFYREAMMKTKNTELQGIFKYLSKIEAEYASLIKKILKCELPLAEKVKETAADNDFENLKSAHEREKTAAAFYKQSADEAIEPRIKKVFTALSEIESDHINLEGVLIENFTD